MSSFIDAINFSEPTFLKACFLIAFQPIWWNTVARLEYKTHFLTKIFCNNKYWGCYFLAFLIFTTSLYRDYVFDVAVGDQKTSEFLGHVVFKIVAVLLFSAGSVFVLTSMWRLGVTGTYLGTDFHQEDLSSRIKRSAPYTFSPTGDYFGILMKERVTGFPFNTIRDPMYTGSSMCFLAKAIWSQSPTGLVLSVVVYVVYRIALLFEGPFTDFIYSQKAKQQSSKKKK
eukprot:TRINITY_DN8642_c0_g1_i2.p1 TRINITY_DN8642_c0_g1~~TRINITY_DN8642_c0_g1_i2.p1  ORF type:complete len:227 (+),score=46.52 TRINITY_DN8642_c0_g1_i2:176-856(+)